MDTTRTYEQMATDLDDSTDMSLYTDLDISRSLWLGRCSSDTRFDSAVLFGILDGTSLCI